MSEMKKLREFENDCQREKRERNALYTTIQGDIIVSTGYRESSANVSFPPWFYETYIFRQPKTPGEEREFLGDATGIDHFKVCQWIINNGMAIIKTSYFKD